MFDMNIKRDQSAQIGFRSSAQSADSGQKRERVSNTNSFLPADEFELMMLDIWKQVLNVKVVSVTDNFFDLGGNSFLVVQLLAAVKAATGASIPPWEMFRAGTIRHMAQILRDGVLPETQETVIQVQAGDLSKHRRFFAIVEAGVDATGYLKLARYINKEQPFYLVRGRGEHGERLYTNEQHGLTAESYIRAMRAVQPHGPYCLGGVCQGAIIAFEMVRQLEQMGERVAVLLNINTWPRENSRNRVLARARALKRRWSSLNPVTLTDKYRIVARALQNRTRWAIYGRNSAHAERNQVYWPKAYVIPTVDCKIVVLRTFQQFWMYKNNRELGWQERTSSHVTVKYIEGHPLMVFREPQVKQLARHISEIVELAMGDPIVS